MKPPGLSNRKKSTAARAQEAVQGLRESLKRDTAKKDVLANELTGAPQLRQELAAAEAEYQRISRERSRAQEAVGSGRAKLNRLAELEVKKKEYEERIAQSAKEESIYRELAKAFGKTGIQALIIEAALPEIAEEANRLLARLTDSRMTVKFESQKKRPRKISLRKRWISPSLTNWGRGTMRCSAAARLSASTSPSVSLYRVCWPTAPARPCPP